MMLGELIRQSLRGLSFLCNVNTRKLKLPSETLLDVEN